MLPKDYAARKAIPLYTYLTQYHPNALVEVAKVAVAGNEQHNPGEPMHWAKGKSMDQLNTAMRHQFDHGMGNAYDTDDPYRGPDGNPILHLAKATWRLLAEIELLCEARDLGIDINELVRGTHEFRGLVETPKHADVGDYLTQLENPSIAVPLAPVGTGPLEAESSSQLPTPTVVIPMPPVRPPRGRLLACGCFANCSGQTPKCPAWKSPAPYLVPDDTSHEAAGVFTNGDPV